MKKVLTAGVRSWKTTTAAILLAVSAITESLSAILDDNASTEPDWSLTAALVIAAVGMLFARDADRTTSDG